MAPQVGLGVMKSASQLCSCMMHVAPVICPTFARKTRRAIIFCKFSALLHYRSYEELVLVLFRQASNPCGQLLRLGPAASGLEACAATSTRSSSISRNSISASRGPDNSCKPAGTVPVAWHGSEWLAAGPLGCQNNSPVIQRPRSFG
jgi:hypothetical protein